MQTRTEIIAATATAESILLAKSATDVLLYDVTKDSIKLLAAASQRAQVVFDRLLTDPDFKATAEDYAALSKQPFKPESATADAVRKSRLALTVPRAGAFFIPAQGKQGIVSTPKSDFLGLGTKGCAGPNVVQPLVGPIDEAPLNVFRPSLLESVSALEKAVDVCEASLPRVLEGLAVQIEGTPLLSPECKSVLLKLLEVFPAGTSTAEYGFEVLAMFQSLGDATFPYPHFQQWLRITSAEKVAQALSEYFDTEQVHSAVRAYCTALANYADSMAATYRAKFVPLKKALRVAQSMAVLVIDIDETFVHASDVEIESEAQLLEVTWKPDTDAMRRYIKRVSEKNRAHLTLNGDTATSRIHVSRARMDMFKRLLGKGQFQSAYFASANNHGRTKALVDKLQKHFGWVRSVEILPREKFMVGDCELRDQKKSIAAIRAAVGVPDDVVVVMVDDKAGAVVGAGARDALVAVRPFMGNDAELDATEERSLEREIAERAAPARACKRKREVTAE
jgi:hypothetical protein